MERVNSCILRSSVRGERMLSCDGVRANNTRSSETHLERKSEEGGRGGQCRLGMDGRMDGGGESWSKGC